MLIQWSNLLIVYVISQALWLHAITTWLFSILAVHKCDQKTQIKSCHVIQTSTTKVQVAWVMGYDRHWRKSERWYIHTEIEEQKWSGTLFTPPEIRSKKVDAFLCQAKLTCEDAKNRLYIDTVTLFMMSINISCTMIQFIIFNILSSILMANTT